VRINISCFFGLCPRLCIAYKSTPCVRVSAPVHACSSSSFIPIYPYTTVVVSPFQCAPNGFCLLPRDPSQPFASFWMTCSTVPESDFLVFLSPNLFSLKSAFVSRSRPMPPQICLYVVFCSDRKSISNSYAIPSPPTLSAPVAGTQGDTNFRLASACAPLLFRLWRHLPPLFLLDLGSSFVLHRSPPLSSRLENCNVYFASPFIRCASPPPPLYNMDGFELRVSVKSSWTRCGVLVLTVLVLLGL